MAVRLRVLSVCSGIGAASTAWGDDRFEFVGYADIDPFSSEWLHQMRGCGRPRYMPSPDEPEISAKEAKARGAAIKAVKHLPAVGRLTNFGDLSRISDDDLRALGRVDVLEGGTPCQAFSLAGLRAGLSDPRGGLLLKFIQLAKRMEVICGLQYVVWENVPGVLSDPEAFGSFLAGFAGGSSRPLEPPRLSWDRAGMVDGPEASVAWRCLDAQYFGLAQRRDRCLSIVRLGAADGADPFGVLAECSGVRRDRPPSRRTFEEGTGDAGEGAEGDHGLSFGIADYSTVSQDIAPTLQSRMTAGGRMDAVAYPVTLTGHGEYVADNGNVLPSLRASGGDCGGGSEALVVMTHGADGPVGTLCASGAGTSRPAGQANELDYCVVHSVAFSAGNSAKARGIGYTEEATPPLRARDSGTNQVPTVASAIRRSAAAIRWIVRRLTPTECERLQGFPDGHTAILVKGKPAADTPRYRALGNSQAVPMMSFIGERLYAAHMEALAEAEANKRAAA